MNDQMTICWRCERQRYEFESCHHCGASCKPLTRAKQEADPSYKRIDGDHIEEAEQ